VGYALVVNGVAGRMGRLVAGALAGADLGRIAGCDVRGDAARSVDLPVPFVPDLVPALEEGGVVVDFSHASATDMLVRAVRDKRAKLVVGTTGQSPAELAALREAAARTAVVLARNFALGLNRLLELLPGFRVLVRDGFDVECLEVHHRAKRDAPSGTALAWLDALLGGGDEAPRVHGRHGVEAAREPGEVGVHSVRLGAVAGEHALLFGSDHEVIELRHRALDRAAFVTGVVPAVRFVRTAVPGLYSMQDVVRHAATAAP
jgi:4-hydroxy-tetrahydrodipicolinate reductase